MQAGNHGAHDVDKSTVGFNIRLPYEQILNKYVSEPASFNYFFTRKVMLTFLPMLIYIFQEDSERWTSCLRC